MGGSEVSLWAEASEAVLSSTTSPFPTLAFMKAFVKRELLSAWAPETGNPDSSTIDAYQGEEVNVAVCAVC